MLDRLIKRVGFLISFLGFFTFIVICIGSYLRFGNPFDYTYNFLTLFLATIVLISSFYPVGKYVHIVCLMISSLTSLYDTPSEGMGMALLVLALLLMYKYKMLEKRPILKICITFSLSIIAVILGSIRTINRIDSITKPMLVIMFFIVFLSSIVLIMYDELAAYMKREKKYKKQIKKLNTTIQETQEYLDKIDAHFIDPVEAGLTKKELILLENLCLYRESNSDLANRLNKSPNTIKVQLTRIMNKIGAETRYQLIDLCRHYYLERQKIDA